MTMVLICGVLAAFLRVCCYAKNLYFVEKVRHLSFLDHFAACSALYNIKDTNRNNNIKDNVDQLGKIVSVLGSQDLLKYVEKYGLELSSELKAVIRKYTMRTNPTGHRKPWLSLLAANNKNEVGNNKMQQQQDKAGRNNSMDVLPLPSQEGLNLLDQLLVYDHELRLTAREAMMHPHPFFDDVREIVGIEVQKRWASERNLAPRNGY